MASVVVDSCSVVDVGISRYVVVDMQVSSHASTRQCGDNVNAMSGGEMSWCQCAGQMTAEMPR